MGDGGDHVAKQNHKVFLETHVNYGLFVPIQKSVSRLTSSPCPSAQEGDPPGCVTWTPGSGVVNY